jgi:hypothetical protein
MKQQVLSRGPLKARVVSTAQQVTQFYHLWIFLRVHFKQFVIRDAPPGTLSEATSSGWIPSVSLTDVMKHFTKHADSSMEILPLYY